MSSFAFSMQKYEAQSFDQRNALDMSDSNMR